MGLIRSIMLSLPLSLSLFSLAQGQFNYVKSLLLVPSSGGLSFTSL